MLNIVVLDRSSVGEDVSVEPLRQYGNVIFHMTTRDEEAAERVKDADIIRAFTADLRVRHGL